jgi:hypothetical protein
MLPASRFSEPPATILAQAVEAAPFVPQDQAASTSWQDEIAAAAPFDAEYQEIVTALRGNQLTVPAVIQRAKVNPGQCRVATMAPCLLSTAVGSLSTKIYEGALCRACIQPLQQATLESRAPWS